MCVGTVSPSKYSRKFSTKKNIKLQLLFIRRYRISKKMFKSTPHILFRNVVLGAALFKQAGRRQAKARRLSTATEDGSGMTADVVTDVASQTSVESLLALPSTCSGMSQALSSTLVLHQRTSM